MRMIPIIMELITKISLIQPMFLCDRWYANQQGGEGRVKILVIAGDLHEKE